MYEGLCTILLFWHYALFWFWTWESCKTGHRSAVLRPSSVCVLGRRHRSRPKHNPESAFSQEWSKWWAVFSLCTRFVHDGSCLVCVKTSAGSNVMNSLHFEYTADHVKDREFWTVATVTFGRWDLVSESGSNAAVSFISSSGKVSCKLNSSMWYYGAASRGLLSPLGPYMYALYHATLCTICIW